MAVIEHIADLYWQIFTDTQLHAVVYDILRFSTRGKSYCY